jgi:hypothetical protein
MSTRCLALIPSGKDIAVLDENPVAIRDIQIEPGC